MKAIKQYFSIVLCTRQVCLLSLWMKLESVIVQMKATKQYFPVVMFINVVQGGSRLLSPWGAVYYAVQGGLSFECGDEILKRDHSNESY